MPRKTTAQQIEEAVEAERRRVATLSLKLAKNRQWCDQVFAALKAADLTRYLPMYFEVQRGYHYFDSAGRSRTQWNRVACAFYFDQDIAIRAAKRDNGSWYNWRVVKVEDGTRTVVHKNERNR